MVDDHAIVREGLKRILGSVQDMEVAGEAATVAEALTLLHQQPFDLVLLDIALPGKSGLELLKFLKTEFPTLPVLILSMYPEDQYAVRVLKQGANGYLTKETAPELLVHAIRRVAAGRKYVSQNLAERLAREIGTQTDKPLHEKLSNREFEILRQIASGHTLTEIAQALCLSVKTVSTYRRRIIEKTGLRNNADMTHYAIANGLVS
jgi:DNA-binding NarL/FixJ family response regulator